MQEFEKFIAKCEANAVPDSEINLTDAPELTDEQLSRMRHRNWRPIKKTITVRIDADTLAWLKSNPKGYQTRLNEVLRWARQNNCPCA